MTTTRHTEQSILLTLDEVGEHLRLSRRTVSRLINAGEITAVHLGHSIRVERVELDRYLDLMRDHDEG